MSDFRPVGSANGVSVTELKNRERKMGGKNTGVVTLSCNVWYAGSPMIKGHSLEPEN
jgi:hypothetical protein